MEWVAIFKVIGQKILGSDRAKELNRQTEIVIKGYRDLYEEQKNIIESHRTKHPENGKELDEWLAREEILHLEQIKLMREKRDLEEEVIFLNAELKRLNRLLNK